MSLAERELDAAIKAAKLARSKTLAKNKRN